MPPNPPARLCLPPRRTCSLCLCWMMKPLTACPASSAIHFKLPKHRLIFLKMLLLVFSGYVYKMKSMCQLAIKILLKSEWPYVYYRHTLYSFTQLHNTFSIPIKCALPRSLKHVSFSENVPFLPNIWKLLPSTPIWLSLFQPHVPATRSFIL